MLCKLMPHVHTHKHFPARHLVAGIGNKCLTAFLAFRRAFETLFSCFVGALLGLKVGTYPKACLQNCLIVLSSGIRD